MRRTIICAAVAMAIMVSPLMLAFAFAGASGMCPLPTELKLSVKVGNNPMGCVYSPGDTIYVDEGDELKFSFFASGHGGGDIDLSTLGTNQKDDTTTDAPDWQPDHMHDTFRHVGPKFSCWSPPNDHDDYGNSHQWGGTGWVVKDINFAYHLDYEGIGHNEGIESGGGATVPANVPFKYDVPSVPKTYTVRVELGLSWQWNYDLKHRWEHTGSNRVDVKGGTSSSGGDAPDGKCDTCGKNYNLDTIDEPFGSVNAVISDPRLPGSRSGDPTKPNWDHECVENCNGTNPLKRSTFLTNNVLKDPQTGKVGKVIVRRFKIVVRDKSSIAHIQTGFNGDNILKAQCGQKLSKTDPDKKLTIRIVDNAACATDPVAIAQVLAPEAKFKDENFQVTFWYEWPVYQYASYFLSVFNETDPNTGQATGPQHNFCNMIYSPMFVWKKGKSWNKLSEFLNDSNNSGDKFGLPYNGSTKTGSDAEFVVYNCTFPLEYLFKGDEPQEDIAPLHYAKGALGDPFGNPAYEKGKDASGLFNSYKPGGKGPAELFKYPPVNFKDGKGPLKYFVEARDCSENGGGKDETKFNCKSHYFSDTVQADKAYVQPQLKYNSDAVKYMVQSSKAGNLLPTDGTGIVTTDVDEGNYCASDDYQGDNIQKKWKDCDFIKNTLNPNVDDAAKILSRFQAWGKIEIEDKIKPNLGLRITNTVKQTTRRIYKKDGYEVVKGGANLPEFSQANLDSEPQRKWALMDQPKKFNYAIYNPAGYDPAAPTANGPGNANLPFDNYEDEWVFDAIPKNAQNKLYEGNEGDQDNLKEGYGVGRDIQLVMTHQDLCESNKAAWFTPYYAYDNIDGQRIPKDGQQFELDDWYKGVADNNKSGNDPINPVFAENFINKGYGSWLIKDELCDQASISGVYKTGNYFNYPQITFSNVNTGWDANPINDKEVSVTYSVIDKNKNHRRLRVRFFVAPTDSSIITIEKKEQRSN